jgi:hypothetical protein
MPLLQRVLWGAFALLLLNSAYLAAFAQANIFYMANVLLHIVGGAVVVGALIWMLRQENRIAAALLALALGIGGAHCRRCGGDGVDQQATPRGGSLSRHASAGDLFL